jgi:transcriptional regulator with XRE-family HTH domain
MAAHGPTANTAPSSAPARESIGARLARLRQMRGWSQVHLARRAGLTPHGVSQIESGRRNGWGIELETAYRLAFALGTSIDVLAGMPELHP